MKKFLLVFCCIGFSLTSSNNSQKENTETADVKNLSAKGVIPILAWHSIANQETTLERFKELKNCGFTHSFTLDYPDNESMEKALDIAQQVGVKLFIATPELKKRQKRQLSDL